MVALMHQQLCFEDVYSTGEHVALFAHSMELAQLASARVSSHCR